MRILTYQKLVRIESRIRKTIGTAACGDKDDDYIVRPTPHTHTHTRRAHSNEKQIFDTYQTIRIHIYEHTLCQLLPAQMTNAKNH